MKSLTLDDLISDLQDAKDLARSNHNPSALVSATLAQAKLLGLDRPIQIDVNNVTPPKSYEMKLAEVVQMVNKVYGIDGGNA